MIIISYDISDNKLRSQFSKYLLKFGYRLQYSVFQMENSERILNNIKLTLDNKFSKRFGESDSVMIFDIKSEKNIVRYGYAKHENEEVIFI